MLSDMAAILVMYVSTLGRVVAPAPLACKCNCNCNAREGMQEESPPADCNLAFFGLFIYSTRNLNEHDIRDLHSNKINSIGIYFITLVARNANDLA